MDRVRYIVRRFTEGLSSEERRIAHPCPDACRWIRTARRHRVAALAAAAGVWLLTGAAGRGDAQETDSPNVENPPVSEGLDRPAPMIHVGVDERVTMHVAQLPLSDVLRMLTEPTRRNVVMANGITDTAITATLYDVTFEDALKAILLSNGLGYRAEGQFIYVHPQAELDRMADTGREFDTRMFRLIYVNAATAQSLLTPLLSDAGKIALTPPAEKGLGGDGGLKDTLGDATASPDLLIISDYVDHLQKIEAMLKSIDQPPRQVLVEATILRATINEDNALGIDFTTVGGIDFQSLSSVSPAAQQITTGATPADALNDTTYTIRTGFNNGLPNGGFTFGIIKDQVGFFVRALEQITDTDVLANPKVLVLNKQQGEVIVGRRDGYLTTTFTETQAIQTVEFLETGTVLTFRPFIGDDGYIRMEIHPKDSTGGLTQAGTPFEQTTETTTNIMIKDGHTVVIGGLFREVDTGARGQVPGLGNVKGLGALFRSTRDTLIREEVIILLTVHVVKSDPYAAAGEAMREQVERYRVGMRQGAQWFGRERLGQLHYRWAIEALQRGDAEKAQWCADMALHNYPHHVPAMQLLESLQNRRTWESEASAIRNFVHDRIGEELGILKPPYGRPACPLTAGDGEEASLRGPMGYEPLDEDPAGGGVDAAAARTQEPESTDESADGQHG